MDEAPLMTEPPKKIMRKVSLNYNDVVIMPKYVMEVILDWENHNLHGRKLTLIRNYF